MCGQHVKRASQGVYLQRFIWAFHLGVLEFMAQKRKVRPMENLPAQKPGFERWPPSWAKEKPLWDMPGWGETLRRGSLGRCPGCGTAPIFDGYLKVNAKCAACGAPLGEMPADDAPPYIAMLVVLHFLALFVVFFYKGYFRPGLIMDGFLLLLLALLCMAALRMAKGAVIGILLKLGLQRARG